MTAPQNQIDQLCEWLNEARTKTLPAFRNLHELQPGFPPTTPGNGSPGGGSGGHGDSIVERQLDDNGNIRPDDATTDLTTATTLIRRMRNDIRDYRDIMQRWGYTTAGEYTTGERRQPGRPTEGDANREKWCTHHEKFGICEPLGKKGRAGVCGWCYGWQAAEGELPPGTLIEHRDRGGTVTTAMVTAWRKERIQLSAATKQRDKRRAKRRKR